MLAKNSLTRLQITGQPAIVPQPQTLNEVLRLQKKQASDAVPKPTWCRTVNVFLNGSTPASFLVYFHSFQTQFLQKKTVGVSGIRTRIVGVEGKHADHLTTTTAPHRR